MARRIMFFLACVSSSVTSTTRTTSFALSLSSHGARVGIDKNVCFSRNDWLKRAGNRGAALPRRAEPEEGSFLEGVFKLLFGFYST